MHKRLLLSLLAVPAAAVGFSATAQAQPTPHQPHSTTTHKETAATAVEHRLQTELHAVVAEEKRLVKGFVSPLAKDVGSIIGDDIRYDLRRGVWP